MPQFMVESTHTPEECLSMLDEIAGQGTAALQQWRFACATGQHDNHTTYAFLEAPNARAATAMAGDITRRNANVTEVAPLTQEQIRGFHQAA
ncbi:MAG: hypothetical protein WC211_02680 [Dehalococcoidia bacterium]